MPRLDVRGERGVEPSLDAGAALDPDLAREGTAGVEPPGPLRRVLPSLEGRDVAEAVEHVPEVAALACADPAGAEETREARGEIGAGLHPARGFDGARGIDASFDRDGDGVGHGFCHV